MKFIPAFILVFGIVHAHAAAIISRDETGPTQDLISNITFVESQTEVVTIEFAMWTESSSTEDAQKLQAEIKGLLENLDQAIGSCNSSTIEDSDSNKVVEVYSTIPSKVQAMAFTILVRSSEIRSDHRVADTLLGDLPGLSIGFQTLGDCLLDHVSLSSRNDLRSYVSKVNSAFNFLLFTLGIS